MQITLKDSDNWVLKRLRKDAAPDALKSRIMLSSVKYSYYEIFLADAKIESIFCIIAANQK
jgi:hypothetical protein